MARIELLITDSRSGGYCTIILDNGEKIVISHNKGGSKGGLLTIDIERMGGLASDRILTCDLDSSEGKVALTQLIVETPEHSVDATPLMALVEYVKECPSTADVETKCAALMARPLGGG